MLQPACLSLCVISPSDAGRSSPWVRCHRTAAPQLSLASWDRLHVTVRSGPSAEMQPEKLWLRPENAECVRAAHQANEQYERSAAANRAAAEVNPTPPPPLNPWPGGLYTNPHCKMPIVAAQTFTYSNLLYNIRFLFTIQNI